ncbi:hypothetical protein [Arcanobacterium canis]
MAKLLLQDALFSVPTRLADALLAEGCVRVEPMELYRDVFRLGEGLIQVKGEAAGQWKTNPIIVGHDGVKAHRKILFEDTFEATLSEFSDYEWAFISGCTYWGRQNTAERSSKLYALIFDLDGVGDKNVLNLFSGARSIWYPMPNYVVESGHGLHLYYLLEEPLSLYPNVKTQMKNLKYDLTRHIWNRYTSTVEKVQYQGINQSFRAPGSCTKLDGVRVQAWRTERSDPYSVSELNKWVTKPENQVDEMKVWADTTMSLAQAKEKYPEWYQRVVVEGEPAGQWKVKPALYEWWLRQIGSGHITYGHRYFYIMALAIYAAKCGIYDIEKVRSDAVNLIPALTAINPEHPFTETDIDSALECLDARYTRFPRHDIEKLTQIPIPPNKRNGRKQELHLKGARFIQQINDEANGTNWRYHGGAPKKNRLVYEWRQAYPSGRKIDCERETGISRPTVLKWWDWVPGSAL